MKNDLLCLIEQIDYIKSFFHIVGGTGIPQLNVIYDKAEFSAWKQELQLELEGIHDRTHDKFIWSTLTLLKQGFSGWKDEQSYNELSGSLLAIRKNIDKYYPAEINRTQNDNDKEEQEMPQKKPEGLYKPFKSRQRLCFLHCGLFRRYRSNTRATVLFINSGIWYSVR